MRFVVVTGLSGAGKTHALHALEDIGYYCVDNLPPMLMPSMASMCMNAAGAIERVAVVMDVRGGVFFEGVDEALANMHKLGIEYEILFLNASGEELTRRYKETRRSHPMGNGELVVRSIEREREALGVLLRNATRVIDTTSMLTRELRETIVRIYGSEQDSLKVNVISFGFKRGMPQDADIVLDVRFLPNPFYVTGLREFTGLDEPVRNYINSHKETDVFMEKTADYLKFMLPLYEREGKSQLVIAVGCTGGQHRSVYLAQRIAQVIIEAGYHTAITHRDIPR